MVSERIAEYISERGIKQSAIADAIGIKPQLMSRTLQGRRMLSADEYRDICIFLNVPFEKFFVEAD